MERKLIIDGNAIYEIDENCMLKKHLGEKGQKQPDMENESQSSDKISRAE